MPKTGGRWIRDAMTGALTKHDATAPIDVAVPTEVTVSASAAVEAEAPTIAAEAAADVSEPVSSSSRRTR